MKKHDKTELRVGITVITAILLLLWVIAWAKNVTFFEDERFLKISFDSVAGLESGDMVSVNGVRKGYIENIELNEGRVLVTANLDDNADIRDDAEFSIMMLDLMGGKKLEIRPGTSSTAINFDTIHSGKFSGDISTAMAMLSGVEDDLKSIIEELRITLNSVNKIITDEKFAGDLKSGVVKLNRLADQMSALISDNREGIKSLIDSSNSFVSASNKFIAENKDDVSALIDRTKQFVVNSNRTVTKFDSLLTEITERKNNVGKLLYDEKLISDLKASLEEVKKLTRMLVEQLEGEGINVDANLDLF